MAGFRDRFFTPKVARAILSPSGMLLAGGAAALTILAGGGVLAIPAAVIAWGARVFAAVPRGKQDPRVDPFVLSEPWRGYVHGAQVAKLRFDRTVKSTADGPIKQRLLEMAERLDDGIADCWRVAKRGDDIDAALTNLSTREAEYELAELQRFLAGRQPTEAQASTLRSLEAQLASAARMQATVHETADRLRLLDARLDELVATAVEVSVGAADSSWLSNEVDGVVGELESLRLAIEDTNAAAAGRPAVDIPLPAPRSQPQSRPRPDTQPGSQTFPPGR